MKEKTVQPCSTCKHYNNRQGDYDCMFCDEQFEDRWEPIEEEDAEQ